MANFETQGVVIGLEMNGNSFDECNNSSEGSYKPNKDVQVVPVRAAAPWGFELELLVHNHLTKLNCFDQETGTATHHMHHYADKFTASSILKDIHEWRLTEVHVPMCMHAHEWRLTEVHVPVCMDVHEWIHTYDSMYTHYSMLHVQSWNTNMQTHVHHCTRTGMHHVNNYCTYIFHVHTSAWKLHAKCNMRMTFM